MSLVAEAPPLSDMLAGWSDRFKDELVAALLKRLGVSQRDREADRSLTAALLRALQSREAGIDRIFFDWRGGRDPGAERYPSEHFRSLAAALEGREEARPHAYWSDAEPCSMHIEEVESIWSAIAEKDDWSALEKKVAAIRRMGEAMADQRTAT
jgi:uncharacterized protein YdiU (UPF0061 family)